MTSDVHADPRLQDVALDILEETRQTLLMTLRFMGPALYVMPFARMDSIRGAFATDGWHLGYNPMKVLWAFRDDPNELLREYLQLIVHCIYRHPFDGRHPRIKLWDAACDVAAEATALELVGERFPCAQDDRRLDALDELQAYCPVVTAQKLYRCMAAALDPEKGGSNVMPVSLENRLEGLFARDDHGLWPRREPQAGQAESESVADMESGFVVPEAMDGSVFVPIPWEDISRQVQAGIEVQRDQSSFEADTMLVNLGALNRKKADYRQFLRRFAHLAEDAKVSADEFDYAYYAHGLNLYGNAPLVEPLEYQEVSRVREFVIAIDTSASCSGDVVRHFVAQTYDLLKSTSGFGASVNVHIVQCDFEIRNVLKVTCVEDLDNRFENFEARGFGRTDFRPVFEYVERALENREFRDLRGMVYLTDGEGEYPSYAPPYETVFVFLENNPSAMMLVPPWAAKVVMDEEDVLEL